MPWVRKHTNENSFRPTNTPATIKLIPWSQLQVNPSDLLISRKRPFRPKGKMKQLMNAKVKQTLESIVQRFKEGDIPEAIAYSMFPIPDIPSSRWSLLNRTLMFISGTSDARSFRQWNGVRRYIKKKDQKAPRSSPHDSQKNQPKMERKQRLSWQAFSPFLCFA